jgi:hypothetical protein
MEWGYSFLSMRIVSDSIIDDVIEYLDTLEEDYDVHIESMAKKQPMLVAYLESETMEVLSEEERDFLMYLALVIFKAVERVNKNIPQVTEAQLGEAEEHNWELAESAKGAEFNERLDVFFNEYAHEDLLAFVEESLTDDPDDEDNLDFITKEGREPLFVAAKTVIDGLYKAMEK